MEEMRQACVFCISAWTNSGGADNKIKEPVNVADGKIVLPPKEKVLSAWRVDSPVHPRNARHERAPVNLFWP